MRPGTRPGAALALTAGGLVLMLRYHTPASRSSEVAARPAASAPVASAPVASATPQPSPSAGRATAPPRVAPTAVTRTVFVSPTRSSGAAGANGPRASSAATEQARAAPVQTFTCQEFPAGSFGPVQVRIKVQGDRWLDVVNLKLPHGDSQTNGISAYAGPQLRREALKAENANIDNVSGATYTAYAYKQSLQSCIDQW
jgi:uncharacterized protein with FMN-binding domain